ncbi:MAG TPA: methyltransferase domain-containing protein [Burkholderiales bacterium]|nr:methyltransferase domain-containing protein [Burkholderiales bacterium]
MQPQHELTAPSDWVCRFVKLIPAGGAVLDLACGTGRHARLLAGLGYRVEAVDRDESHLQALRGVEGVTVRLADLESRPWPYARRQFAGITVCNYLHRPLFPRLLEALEQEGVLIYETFAVGNERFGKPSNPDFLLKPGELLEVVRGQLRVIAYEDVFVSHPKPAMVQRICARRDNV